MASKAAPEDQSNLRDMLINLVQTRFNRRFSLHLTLEGWCMVAIMMLIGLAALNTAAPLLYLMFSMLCAFFVLSALLASNSINRLSINRICPRIWQARVPLMVELRLKNAKRLTSSYSLRVEDRLENEQTLGAVFFDHAPPKNIPTAETYECLFLKRGVYRLNNLKLATRFPFGLIERIFIIEQKTEVLVLPQGIPISNRMEQARTDLGDYQSHQKGFGAGLYGLRKYTPEVSARDIHWKISARRGELIVREYESEERRRASVILDNRIPSEDRSGFDERFEKSIVLAASVIDWLCANGHEVELRTASGIIGFGAGLPHLTRCRRCLARLTMIEPSEGDSSMLFGGEEGVVCFPILLKGTEVAIPGRHPISIDEFIPELKAAFEPDGSRQSSTLSERKI